MTSAELSRDAPEFSPTDAGVALRRKLAALAARRNAHRLVTGLIHALAWGVGACALMMLAHRLYLADVSPWAIVTVLLASALIGARNGSLRRAGVFDAALDADTALGSADRLSSAMAFVQPDSIRRAHAVIAPGGKPWHRLRAAVLPRLAYHTSVATSPTDFVPALVHDASARAGAVTPKSVYPYRFDRHTIALIIGLVALVGFTLMPNIEWLRTPEQRAFSRLLKREGASLEAIAKQVQNRPDAQERKEATKRLTARLKALGIKMQRGRMSKRVALTSIGQLKKDMEGAQSASNDSENGGLENIDQLAQSLSDKSMQSPETRDMQQGLRKKQLDKAADQLDALARKMENGELSEPEKQKAATDMLKAAQALRQTGGPHNEEAARKLEEAAKQLQGEKPPGQQSRSGSQPQSQAGAQPKSGAQSENGKQQQGQQSQQGHGQGQQQQRQQGQQSQQGQGQGQGQSRKQGQGQSQQGQGQSQQQGQGQGQQGAAGQGANGGSSQGGGGQGGQGEQGGADALRNLANGLRQGAGSGDSRDMRDMLDKIREAENDTGQNSSEASGQGEGKNGQGGGDSQGDGNMPTMRPGKDLMPSDPHGIVGGGAGLGPRNNAGGVGHGRVSNIRAARTGDKRRWEDVWSDRLPKTQDKLSRINGKMGSQGEMEQLPTRTEAKGGPVKTPYYEVYESYKKDAEEAVSKDQVPPAYKQPVKDYFDSLKPAGK